MARTFSNVCDLIEREEGFVFAASSAAGSATARANHSCPEPVWFVVRSPMIRMPRAWTARDRLASAASPPHRFQLDSD